MDVERATLYFVTKIAYSSSSTTCSTYFWTKGTWKFARKPHRKHFCGNCGCDSTWSPGHIVSTPLKPLYDQFAKNTQYKEPDRTLNLDLDKYSGCDYEIWASTSAILWTAERPQEKGIHVHVNDGRKRIVDDTFSVVVLNGKPLERKDVLQAMFERTIT